jgi:glycosyltransferase involved in cell wall biosynthesis
MLKICMPTTSFPLTQGDPSGSFIFEQARHLVNLGIEVDILAPHNFGVLKKEDMDGVSIHRFRYVLPEGLQTLCYRSGIPENMKGNTWAKLQLPFLTSSFILQTIIHGMSCQVIHAHWTIAGLAGLIAGRLLHKPVVMTLHHGTTKPIGKIERFVIEQVDYIVFNSTFTLSTTLKTAKPRAYKIIPPGTDVDRFKPRPKGQNRADLIPAIPPDRPIIFSMGRLIELKGHKYLIEALTLLNEEPKPYLLIGGDGYLRDELKEYARARGVAERVIFLGSIPHELTPNWYSAVDVYVQPSIIDKEGNTEGLGMTPMEALSCEIPCVCSKVGGIPDLIVDGVNGYLVEPANAQALADKISILLKDKVLRMEMGKKGRSFIVDNFSWEAKAKELVEVYRSVI